MIGRILVVMTLRSLDPGTERAMLVLRRHPVLEIELPPIEPEAARALLGERAPHLPASVVDDIVRRAAGNPLLLEEMALSGDPSPVLARTLTARLDLLGAPAAEAVRVLAIADRPLPKSALGPHIDEAIRVGIVTETAGTVAIRHELVGAALRERLDEPARRHLHARAAELVGGGAEAARHLALAGQHREATDEALRAAAGASDGRERAAALVIAAEASAGPAAAALRLQAGRSLDEVAEWATAQRVLADLGPAATLEEQVEAEAILAHAAYARGDVERCRRHLAAAHALEVPATSDAAIRREIEAATMLVNLDGQVGAALERLAGAAAILDAADPRLNDVLILAESIRLLATGSGDPKRVRLAADQALEAGRYRTATDWARVLQYLAVFHQGSEAALDFLLDRYAVYEAARIESVALAFLADAANVTRLAGSFERSIELADSVLEQPASARVRQTAQIARARAWSHLGRIDEAEAALASLQGVVSPDYFGLGETLQGRSEAALWGGRPADALDLAEASLQVHAPIPGATLHSMLAKAWALRDLDRPPDRMPEVPIAPWLEGAPFELEALDRWHERAFADAAIAFDAAATAWRPFHVPRALMARWAAGESRRRAGSVDEAVATLRDVLADASTVEFQPAVTRIRRSLRLAGVRLPASAARSTSTSGLTARERELVQLVERGLTNLEIARRLGLGRPTVARILASAMSKVGVSRRTGLVGATDA